MKSIFAFVFVVGVLLFPGISGAAESLEDRVKSLEPIIGGHPPNIKSEEELKVVQKKYLDLKAELDSLLLKQPKNQELLFLRGHLQSMGHNFDAPGAWQGSTDDFSALLKENPSHVPAIIELAMLWVNSNPKLAPNAEKLFRGAQCYHGNQPLEVAQRGIWFALYYQGKMNDALRQSEFLTKTWPQNEQYRKFNEITRNVVARTKKDTDVKEPATDKLVMASCNN